MQKNKEIYQNVGFSLKFEQKPKTTVEITEYRFCT
jgi:hypothetical protein